MKSPVYFRKRFEIEKQGCALLAHVNTLVHHNMVRMISKTSFLPLTDSPASRFTRISLTLSITRIFPAWGTLRRCARGVAISLAAIYVGIMCWLFTATCHASEKNTPSSAVDFLDCNSERSTLTLTGLVGMWIIWRSPHCNPTTIWHCCSWYCHLRLPVRRPTCHAASTSPLSWSAHTSIHSSWLGNVGSGFRGHVLCVSIQSHDLWAWAGGCHRDGISDRGQIM